MHLFGRDQFADILNAVGLTGNAVEVGVDRGDFAARFLMSWKGERLYLVDPWEPRRETQGTQWLYDGASAQAHVEKWARNEPRATMLKLASADAAKAWAAQGPKLDWVYIDAGHGYADVRADVRAWWPHLKPGGMLAGHDYFFAYKPERGNDEDGWHCGVEAAVDHFAFEQGVIPRCSIHDEWPSWYIWKPIERTPTVAVFSCAFDDYPGKAEAFANHTAYCNKWGYEYHMELPVELHWHKVRRFLQIMEQGHGADWLFWIDADALFTNWKKPLTSVMAGSPFDLIVGWCDPWATNTGTFAIRNSPRGQALLREWLSVYECFAHDKVFDNGALNHLLSTRRAFADSVEITQTRLLNSFPKWNKWAPHDIIAHFPAAGPRRADLMRDFAAWATDHNV